MFIDNLVTRYPNGVTNVAVNDIFNSLKMPDPNQYHVFSEDFDTYLASDWTVTVIGTTPTAALDNDGIALQLVKETFFPVAGKKTFFFSRFKLSDATQMDFLVGLQITDTTPFDATDGIYFIKADDAATLSVICRKNTSTGSTTAVVGTLADNTFVTVAFFYDGVDRLYYALNGTAQGYLDASSTFLPDAGLTVSVAMLNGAAASKVATVDRIWAAQER